MLAVGLALPAMASAQVTKVGIQIKNGPTWSVPSGAPNDLVFAGGDNKAFRACGTNRTLGVGWVGSAPVARATSYQGESLDRDALLGVYRGHTAAKLRPIVVCGLRTAPGRTVIAARNVVRCAAGFVGLGIYRNGFGGDTPIVSEPAGAAGSRAWRYDANTTGAQAQCVRRATFGAMSKVTRKGTLQPGQMRASVTAVCPRGQRAITWGTRIDPSPANRFKSVNAPYITSIVPTINSWRLTVATPDNLPAKEASSFSVIAVCGAPGTAYVPPRKKR